MVPPTCSHKNQRQSIGLIVLSGLSKCCLLLYSLILHICGIERFYRWKTRLHALYSLAMLDSKEIDRFLESYILFDGDWSTQNGKNEDHIVAYYNVINHLCALGNVEKMYIPPLRDPNVSLTQNQILYEIKMMEDIGLFDDSNCKKVLDVGCGRGRIAIHLATVVGGAHVTGINIDPSQLENAIDYSQRIGMQHKTQFVLGSLNNPLPFPDESFDAAYQVQAFTYAKNKVAVFQELFRVLKPGAKFSYLDWVLLDNYDPQNDEHVHCIRHVMPFIGAVDTVHYSEIEKAMQRAGFKILASEDASIGGHQLSLINSERQHYAWVRFFARVFLPARFMVLLNRLKEDAEEFSKADELGIATTSYQIVCQKPAKNVASKSFSGV